MSNAELARICFDFGALTAVLAKYPSLKWNFDRAEDFAGDREFWECNVTMLAALQHMETR